ncbi:MAG: sortase [Lachnospiraceae bacterium]|nr:sortase [Lachnospiraceae bacterium]
MITLGLLCVTAAFSLIGYNYYESYKAGKASESVMEQLESAIAEASGQKNLPETADDEAGREANVSSQPQNKEAAEEVISGTDTVSGGHSASEQQSTGETVSPEVAADPQAGDDNNSGMNMGELYPDRDMPSLSVNSLGYIGWIFIPSLSLRLPVQENWNYDLLTVSPARYSGSVYQDNMIIGGHSYITHFRGLRTISPGAKVTFFDTEGYSYQYEVAYTMVLNPNQGVVLSDEENEDWDLTLFTCNTGSQTRCVVRCVAIDRE